MAQLPTTTELTAEATVQTESAPSGLAALGVNPTMLAVQVINFLLLLVLLRVVLYKPIVELLRKRRAAIKQGLADAQRASEAAASAEAQASQLLLKARSRAHQIVDDAKLAAEKLSAELHAKASTEAEQLLERTRTQLTQEKAAILGSAEHELGELVVRATERVLATQSLKLEPKQVEAAIRVARGSQ